MKRNLLVSIALLLTVVAVAFAQDPAIFFQGIQIHRDRLLLGNGINIVSWGAGTGANATTLTFTTPTAARTVTVPDATGTMTLNTGPTSAPRFESDTIQLSNTNPINLLTQLTSVIGCSATLKSSDSPGTDPTLITVMTTAGNANVSIYAWKPVSTSVTTLTSSSNTTHTVSVICVGT